MIFHIGHLGNSNHTCAKEGCEVQPGQGVRVQVFRVYGQRRFLILRLFTVLGQV